MHMWQALFSDGGYVYLDVRPKLEYDEAGKVPGSVNIPIVNSERKWDPEQQKKVSETSSRLDVKCLCLFSFLSPMLQVPYLLPLAQVAMHMHDTRPSGASNADLLKLAP